MKMKQLVHFVGFRTKAEFDLASKIWGKPDFVHKVHDARLWTEVAKGDIVIFSQRENPAVPRKHTYDDSAHQ